MVGLSIRSRIAAYSAHGKLPTFPAIAMLLLTLPAFSSSGTSYVYFPLAYVKITLPNFIPPTTLSLTPILQLSMFNNDGVVDSHSVKYSLDISEDLRDLVYLKNDSLYLGSTFIHQDISYKLTVTGSQFQRTVNRMTVIIVLSNEPLDCQQILREICFWRESSYFLHSEVKSPAVIGPLSAPFYTKLCPQFPVKYEVIKGTDMVKLVTNKENMWNLEINSKTSFSPTIRCTISQEGTSKILEKSLTVKISKEKIDIAPISDDVKLRMYPNEPIDLYKTARNWARVLAPKNFPKTRFELKPNSKLFGITKDGIIYVMNSSYMNDYVTSVQTTRLNVTWRSFKGPEQHWEVLKFNILTEDSKKTCMHSKSRYHCAKYDNKKSCINACGVGTGHRKDSFRCKWNVGDTYISNNYTTCTPDPKTCPDQICDSLEQLEPTLCPQDCTVHVTGPYQRRNSSNGIWAAQGLCYCYYPEACYCHDYKPSNETDLSSTINATKIEDKVFDCNGSCMATISIFGVLVITVIGIILYYSTYKKSNKRSSKKTLKEEFVQMNYDEYLSADNCRRRNSVVFPQIAEYFDKKWEFPRHRLTLEDTLGEGQFGRVIKARADGISGQEGTAIVAVKTLKKFATEPELADLISEYQLLKEVDHPNIIKLLGACTTPDGPLMVIIEYAEHGSLLNYLRKHKPNADENETSYLEPKMVLTPGRILTFAWQIAKGMAYLAEMKLVHRDLAARNILLSHDLVCKISDFGLTRDIYEDDTYLKRSKGRVPIKWMAIESLKDHIYTSKSDVWSYGIVLWELVNTGDTPYPGISIQSVFALLEDGFRMEKPVHCSEALYRVMHDCWLTNPTHRPTFKALVVRLEHMLTEGSDYLDLNPRIVENKAYFLEEKETELKWNFDFYDRPQKCECTQGVCTCQVTITTRYYNDFRALPEDNNTYVPPIANIKLNLPFKQGDCPEMTNLVNDNAVA